MFSEDFLFYFGNFLYCTNKHPLSIILLFDPRMF